MKIFSTLSTTDDKWVNRVFELGLLLPISFIIVASVLLLLKVDGFLQTFCHASLVASGVFLFIDMAIWRVIKIKNQLFREASNPADQESQSGSFNSASSEIEEDAVNILWAGQEFAT